MQTVRCLKSNHSPRDTFRYSWAHKMLQTILIAFIFSVPSTLMFVAELQAKHSATFLLFCRLSCSLSARNNGCYVRNLARSRPFWNGFNRFRRRTFGFCWCLAQLTAAAESLWIASNGMLFSPISRQFGRNVSGPLGADCFTGRCCHSPACHSLELSDLHACLAPELFAFWPKPAGLPIRWALESLLAFVSLSRCRKPKLKSLAVAVMQSLPSVNFLERHLIHNQFKSKLKWPWNRISVKGGCRATALLYGN